MNRFQGIRQEDMWLLAENRFQDSKAFYEDHKPQLRAGILQPLQALFSDMAPEMLKIDPQIVADPMRNGSVSRIRRDNRYTRDKAMYRENMWISFLRDKKAWDNLPGFYLDISLRGSSYGVGFYHPSPRLMQTLRRMIDETPDDFVQAMSRAEAAGFVCEGDRYARPKRMGCRRCSTRCTTAALSTSPAMNRIPPFSAGPTCRISCLPDSASWLRSIICLLPQPNGKCPPAARRSLPRLPNK